MMLVYIGDRFYRESGTMMSSIYTEDGKRYDWGFVHIALQNGEEIYIRQATKEEMLHYEKKLSDIVGKKDASNSKHK